MDGDLCGGGCFHGGSGKSSSTWVANKNRFRNGCVRSLGKGNNMITSRIYTRVARSGIFILFFLTLFNLFVQNMYYKSEEWESFSKLELGNNGCSRILAEIKQVQKCGDVAGVALNDEESDYVTKYKEEYYKRKEERMKQMGQRPLPNSMNNGGKVTTVTSKTQCVKPEGTFQNRRTPNRIVQRERNWNEKNKKNKNGENKKTTIEELKKKHEDILYQKISKEEMKENFDFADASNYENIQRKKNVVYNEDDNDQLQYGCKMADISTKITERDLNFKMKQLPYNVKQKDMFIIWHYVQGFGRDKHLTVMGNLWRICGSIQKEYNIPEDIKRKEWQKVASCMSQDLLEKEHNDYLEFKKLVEQGSCNRGKFYTYIDNLRDSWNALTANMLNSWKEVLISRLKSYRIQEEEKAEEEKEEEENAEEENAEEANTGETNTGETNTGETNTEETNTEETNTEETNTEETNAEEQNAEEEEE
ncbi:hypothetical protein AK88_04563 [Plasmodium fragile]|uniref:Plasmodium RESA N-terminal domain-containing protein n=1 Tax=Plasmodium fragile TaxID=5857 RepID=A0A0D9QFM4_PLAFR|nr:uncharacterized protein AK88_04563 [Plasmodium fragile]KJP85804.1 hypothetical protein AK88_04563 [Plasmodium fragile]